MILNLNAKLAAIRSRDENENGFTLIELMIVVVIIGILAAIAIPVFASQQKSAMAATVKSDVRNTVGSVADFLTKNPTASETELAQATKVFTDGNAVTISGPWDRYKVRASSMTTDDLGMTVACSEFDSTTGKITDCVGGAVTSNAAVVSDADKNLIEAWTNDKVLLAESDFNAGTYANYSYLTVDGVTVMNSASYGSQGDADNGYGFQAGYYNAQVTVNISTGNVDAYGYPEQNTYIYTCSGSASAATTCAWS